MNLIYLLYYNIYKMDLLKKEIERKRKELEETRLLVNILIDISDTVCTDISIFC